MANAFHRWKQRHHQSAPYHLHMSLLLRETKAKSFGLPEKNRCVKVREMAAVIRMVHHLIYRTVTKNASCGDEDFLEELYLAHIWLTLCFPIHAFT